MLPIDAATASLLEVRHLTSPNTGCGSGCDRLPIAASRAFPMQ